MALKIIFFKMLKARKSLEYCPKNLWFEKDFKMFVVVYFKIFDY